MSETTYRILPPEEWFKIAPIFEAEHVPLPTIGLATIAAAEIGDQVVGFCVLQVQPHMEPLWIDEKHRAHVNYRRFQEMLEPKIPAGMQVFAFTGDHRTAALAEMAGFRAIPVYVLVKEVGCPS
jgi:hypothetical protein